MNMEVLEELRRQIGVAGPAFVQRYGCVPTVVVVPAALMRRLVGDMRNCVVYVGGLTVLADPTADELRLTALEIPDSLRASPSRPARDTRALH